MSIENSFTKPDYSSVTKETKISDDRLLRARIFTEYVIGKTIEKAGDFLSLPALPLLKGYIERIKISG